MVAGGRPSRRGFRRLAGLLGMSPVYEPYGRDEKHEARKLSIEKEMDLKRVFTCPLSLHRSLNLAAVCFSPDMINDFSPDWASVGRYRHWKGWDRFETGEADHLAEKAYQIVGAYPLRKIPGLLSEREIQRLN